jgi:hypothetical protein
MCRLIFVLTFLLFILIATEVKCQSDSLKVFFIGAEFPGEKFKVFFNGRQVLSFRSADYYKHSFSIPIGSSWKYGTKLFFEIKRKCKFCLFYRDTGFNPFYEPNYKYLIINRNPMLKNKYAVSYKWSNEEPFLIEH